MTSDADRELAINWWDLSTEVSSNKKDVIRLHSKDKSPVLEHCIHRQYLTDEQIYTAFMEKSGCLKMSLTYFTDLKPWYVRKGTDDTCLCRNCEDFRLAKKAVTYHVNVLERPYLQLNVLRRFLLPYLLSLRLKKQLESEGQSPSQGTIRITYHFFRSICLPLLSIGALCQKRSGSGIVKRLICPEALPDNDHRGSPSCYGECSKNQL